MAVNTTLAGLSQTAASNGPDGSADPPSALDDAIRYALAFIAQLRDGNGFTAQLGTRNRIINGNFPINQRAVSGTVTLAAGVYGHDRWKAGAAGCTYTFTTSGIDTTITISAGSLQQVIEGVNVEGGTYTMSWSGTSQGKINGGAYSATGVQATGVSAGANITVEFNVGSISKVQVECNGTASQFERRPYGYELLLCQRYYEIGSNQLGGAYPTGSSGAQTIGQIAFKAFKRTTPTMTQLASSSSSNVSANSFLTAGPSGCGISVTIGAAAGNYSLNLDWSASAEL